MIFKPCPSLLYRIGFIFAFLEPEDNQILYAEMARMFIVSIIFPLSVTYCPPVWQLKWSYKKIV